MLPDIAAAIAARAANIGGGPDWLAPGAACDLALGGIAPDTAERAARETIGDAAIDVVVQPLAGRRKRVLVADLESTIIENEMLDELADFVGMRAAGRRDHAARDERRTRFRRRPRRTGRAAAGVCRYRCSTRRRAASG